MPDCARLESRLALLFKLTILLDFQLYTQQRSRTTPPETPCAEA
jgi:hypothetical protein